MRFLIQRHTFWETILSTNHSIIGKYERNEVKPNIDVVLKLAEHLNTTFGYYLGESEDMNMLKDLAMLRRFKEVNALPEDDKHCVISLIATYLA